MCFSIRGGHRGPAFRFKSDPSSPLNVAQLNLLELIFLVCALFKWNSQFTSSSTTIMLFGHSGKTLPTNLTLIRSRRALHGNVKIKKSLTEQFCWVIKSNF